MKLVLWLIVAANCHFINGSSVDERVGRAATDPVVSFNKLTEEENRQRRRECGGVADRNTDVPPPTHITRSAVAPWVVAIYREANPRDYDSLVVISKRHLLADRHALRHLNMTKIFGDYTNKPTQVLSSSLAKSDLKVRAVYCENNAWNNCHEKDWEVSPSKIIIDNSWNPKIVLFEFESEERMPITPICLPFWNLMKGDQVLIQNIEDSRAKRQTNTLSDILPNGRVSRKTNDTKTPFSQVMVRKELGRFAIVGISEQYTSTSDANYQLFSSVFPLTEKICKWTGACPSLPHVDFKGISKEENEERIRTCGRRTGAPKLSDAIKLVREAPWMVDVRRSDGLGDDHGIVISQRHIITHASSFSYSVYLKFHRNSDAMEYGIHSTGIPMIDEYEETLTYKMTISVCADDKCQSKKNKTLTPERVMLVFGNYAIFEMGEDMGVLPACLPYEFRGTWYDRVFLVLKDGKSMRYDIEHSDNEENGTTINDEYDRFLFSGISEHFSEMLIDRRNIVFTVYGMNKHYFGPVNKTISFHSWKGERENICKFTGICPEPMIPIRSKEVDRGKITEEENDERLKTCGILPDASNTSEAFFGTSGAPWLVGIRMNRSSPITHTGVIISKRHILIDGSMLAGEEDLSEIFVPQFKTQQLQMISAMLPKYEIPEFKFNFEVILNRCNDVKCSSKTETVIKPSRLLVYDYAHPSVFVLQTSDNLTNVPICLEDRKEVEDGDGVFIRQYTDPEASVLSVANVSILTRMEPFDAKSKVLVREDGDRTILVGNWAPSGFSNSSSGFKPWFDSMFSLRFKICELTGVCHPVDSPVQFQKLSVEEDKERSRTCGILNPRYHQSASPKEPSIARDAPWIVGIQGPLTQVHTGVVISRRHVLMDYFVLYKDMDDSSFFGTKISGNFTSSLPLPRTNLYLRVKLRVCEDDECNTSKEIEMIPTKIHRVHRLLYLLEFDQDLPVTPICIPDFDIEKGGEVFIQDYMNPASLFDTTTISELWGNIMAIATDVPADRYVYSRIPVSKVDGRFAVTGYNTESSLSHNVFVMFAVLKKYRDDICKATGVCAPLKRSTREAPQTTIRKNRNQPEQREELKEKSDDGRLVSWM